MDEAAKEAAACCDIDNDKGTKGFAVTFSTLPEKTAQGYQTQIHYRAVSHINDARSREKDNGRGGSRHSNMDITCSIAGNMSHDDFDCINNPMQNLSLEGDQRLLRALPDNTGPCNIWHMHK